MKFARGLRDGLPIALGYAPVAFSYAVQAAGNGFPFWFPILVSATNFTGTGQFAGTNLIAAGASLLLLLATMLIINIRYSLMSVSLSQKLEPDFPLWKRAIVAFGVTDENYAVAIRQPQKLTFPYLLGLMSCSFCGWLGGTALGAGMSSLLAKLLVGETGEAYYTMIMSALNISLYAMFVAIIVPPARGDKRLLLLVALSAGASCLFYFVPVLAALPTGLDIILCSLACTAVIAFVFPHAPDDPPGGESSEISSADNEPAESDPTNGGPAEIGPAGASPDGERTDGKEPGGGREDGAGEGGGQ